MLQFFDISHWNRFSHLEFKIDSIATQNVMKIQLGLEDLKIQLNVNLVKLAIFSQPKNVTYILQKSLISGQATD